MAQFIKFLTKFISVFIKNLDVLLCLHFERLLDSPAYLESLLLFREHELLLSHATRSKHHLNYTSTAPQPEGGYVPDIYFISYVQQWLLALFT